MEGLNPKETSPFLKEIAQSSLQALLPQARITIQEEIEPPKEEVKAEMGFMDIMKYVNKIVSEVKEEAEKQPFPKVADYKVGMIHQSLSND